MLIIKETEKADLENVRALWASGEVMKFVGFPNGLEKSAGDMKKWLERIEAHRPNVNHFSIYDDGAYCGEAFYAIDRFTGRAALDIKLFPEARGRGIGRAGLIHAMEEAFMNGADCVYVDPDRENERALRLYEAVGMVQKPMPEELADPDYPNAVYYELTAEAYADMYAEEPEESGESGEGREPEESGELIEGSEE